MWGIHQDWRSLLRNWLQRPAGMQYHQTPRHKGTCYNCKFLQSVLTPNLQHTPGGLKQVWVVILWCGDFNSHNSLWGSKLTDRNGECIESIIDEFDLVLLNDGTGTFVSPPTGQSSPFDLNFVSTSAAERCEWSVLSDSMGSYHFSVITCLKLDRDADNLDRSPSWNFSEANWDCFSTLCSEEVTIEL